MDWRRAARGAIGALGLAGLLALGGARYPAVTPAYADPSVVNAKLARIETYLRHSPHVGQLRTCLASGAEMGIVHIRQIHNLIGNYGIVREIRERGTEADGLHAILLLDEFGLVVNMVQEDIYGILKGMMDDLGLGGVRVEGYLESESREEIRFRYASTIISGLEAGLAETDPPCRDALLSEAVRQTLGGSLVVQPDSCLEEFRYLPGGAEALALERDIAILPLEDPAALRRAIDGIRSGDLSLAIDPREDAIIRRLAREERSIATVVLGAAHELGGLESCGSTLPDARSSKDNIAAWNATEGKKISLLEVTPAIYPHVDEISSYSRRILELLRDTLQSPEPEAQDRP